MKKLLSCIIFIFIICSVFAQATLNPSDAFYNDATRWETLKIISPLPQIRPYSIPLIKSIIETVANCPIESEALLAKSYYEKEFSKFFTFHFEAREDLKLNNDDNAKETTLVPGFGINATILDNFAIAFDFNFVGDTGNATKVLPQFTRRDYDLAKDPAKLKKLSFNLLSNSLVSVGNKDIYMIAGISRSAFGPLPHTSIVLSPDSFHAPYITFVLSKGIFTYSQSLYSLTASNNLGTNNAGTMYPEKYLALHSFDFNLFNNKLTLTYYENMIYGQRFDFTYMLPVPYMVGQAFSGFSDNLQMGVGARLYTDFDAKFTADLFIDDISVNELVKLNFNTKLKLAAQAGAFFAFKDSVAKSLKTDLTLIMPWMYTHHQMTNDPGYGKEYNFDTERLSLGTGVNYQNYTHFAMGLANPLPQNSARLHYEINFEPAKNFSLDIFSTVTCHGNINESLTLNEKKALLVAPSDQFLTDGSIFDVPNAGLGHFESADKFYFLMQPTLMTTTQAGFDAKYTINTKIGDFTFNVKYMFEYINNNGVQNNMFPGNGSAHFENNKLTNPATDAEVQTAYNNWKNKIVPHTFNNYFALSVKFSY